MSENLTKYRWGLALTITLVSMLGIVIVAGVAIGFSDTRSETTQMVFTAVTPLIASWIGAVIAYYFSSDSLETATRSAKDLIGTLDEKLKTIPATRVMIKLTNMSKFKSDDTQKVKEILDELKKSGKGERLPFLNDQNQPVYMLHKSSIDSALVEAFTDTSLNLQDITLKQLFEKVPELKVMAVGSFETVGVDATLDKILTAMGRIRGCQDIFVTEDGTKKGAVIGWVTNGIIEDASRQ